MYEVSRLFSHLGIFLMYYGCFLFYCLFFYTFYLVSFRHWGRGRELTRAPTD